MAFEDTMKYLYTYEDVKIYDPSSIDVKSYKWDQGYYKHKLTRQEIIKPYLISYIYYNDKELWYYILLLNGIVNIEDLPVGTEIWIPIKAELQQFILNNKLKNN